ncbi:MAG: protein phosphatase 2C domain-containing protein, partial [Armatimonadota bacterium]
MDICEQSPSGSVVDQTQMDTDARIELPSVEPATPETDPILTIEAADVLDDVDTSLPELEEEVVLRDCEQVLRTDGERVTLDSTTVVTIAGHLREFAGCQVYAAEPDETNESDTTSLVLFEAFNSRGLEWLQRQAEMLKSVQHPALPTIVTSTTCLETGTGQQLIAHRATEPDLATLIAAKPDSDEVVLAVLPVLDALARVHEAGWVLCGLSPSAICAKKPACILDVSRTLKIGATPSPFAVGAFTAPEITAGECQAVGVGVDVFSIGAILYEAFTGEALTETGVGLFSVPRSSLAGGVGQIIHRCLGPSESRYSDVRQLAQDLKKLRLRRAGIPFHLVAAKTDIGQEYSRSSNQDAFVFLNLQLQSDEGAETVTVACVVDGMGGMAAGEKASVAAIQAVRAVAAQAIAAEIQLDTAQLAQLLRKCADSANAAVWKALGSGDQNGGCTIVLAALVGATVVVAHCGDCRAYIIDETVTQPLTRDHSVVMDLVAAGKLTLD